ncbi:hypothetical protein BRARA_A00664 [Brassica rapa]|uniref:Uncharacterized protein n=1 Tax=Brassica campestris TaxID=3711 RepID=A0A398AR19_BRACM|nr:hypothetical protein BRARA_A00664 [Brassica rapa]
MTAWFPKIIFLAFLVLLLVVHSQARFFLEPTIYEIDDIDDVINEEVKSTYIGDLHEKLMVRYGAKLMWRIDVFLCLCFSLLFTDLLFKLSFRIVSRCSARVSKPIIRCYA